MFSQWMSMEYFYVISTPHLYSRPSLVGISQHYRGGCQIIITENNFADILNPHFIDQKLKDREVSKLNPDLTLDPTHSTTEGNPKYYWNGRLDHLGFVTKLKHL